MSIFDRQKSAVAVKQVDCSLKMEDTKSTVVPVSQQPSVPTSVSSVIGEHVTIRGNIEFDGELIIAGHVIGDICCKEGSECMLTIEDKAEVHGDIIVSEVKILGVVRGSVSSVQHLHVMSTGHIEGPAKYNFIQLDPGAVISGGMSPEFRNRTKHGTT